MAEQEKTYRPDPSAHPYLSPQGERLNPHILQGLPYYEVPLHYLAWTQDQGVFPGKHSVMSSILDKAGYSFLEAKPIVACILPSHIEIPQITLAVLNGHSRISVAISRWNKIPTHILDLDQAVDFLNRRPKNQHSEDDPSDRMLLYHELEVLVSQMQRQAPYAFYPIVGPESIVDLTKYLGRPKKVKRNLTPITD